MADRIQIRRAIEKKLERAKRLNKPWSPVVPRMLFPLAIQRRYEKNLQYSYTKLTELVKNRLAPQLSRLKAKWDGERANTRYDAADDDLRLILEGISIEFSRELTQNEIKQIAERRGLEVSEYNAIQNKKVFKRLLDLDIFYEDAALATNIASFANENAALIKTLSERHIDRVRQIVLKGFREGASVKEIERLIAQSVNGRTRANFRLIARDQIAKLNGQLTEMRQTEVGVTDYIWRTSLDERVRGNPGGIYPNARPSHWAKEGKRYQWGKPPADTGAPGWDYQCRCIAEPVLTSILGE